MDFYNPNAHLRVILPKQLPLGREIRAICPLVKRRSEQGFSMNLTTRSSKSRNPAVSMISFVSIRTTSTPTFWHGKIVCIISTQVFDSDFEAAKSRRKIWTRKESSSLESPYVEVFHSLQFTWNIYSFSIFTYEFTRSISSYYAYTHTHVTQALEIKRDQVKTKRKEQDVLFKSERKAADILFNEKNVQALARIESENKRYEKRMNELMREFDSALDCDRKSYDSKIDRLKSQNQVVASSFESSKEHMIEDMDSKIKVDSDSYSEMIEVSVRVWGFQSCF